MPGQGPNDALDAATNGLRDLALRRHAYYLELLRSGRWRHYFSEHEFAQRVRDVVALTRRWDHLAGAPRPASKAEAAKSAA